MTQSGKAPYLEIRFHLTDGSVERFFQENETAARRILDNLRPSQVFKQARIMIAGTYSISAFVPAHLEKIDFVCEDLESWEFPAGLADVVEITEAQHRKHAGLTDSTRLERRSQARVPGDAAVGFLDLEMQSGRHIYLMVEVAVALPAERLNRLQLLLTGVHLNVRLPKGGMSLVNLANLVRFTVNPGPPETPVDAWPAHHQPN